MASAIEIVQVSDETVNAIAQSTGWRSSQIRTLKQQLAPKATDDEFLLFSEVCKTTGLSPWKKQIYAVSRFDKQLGRDKMSIQTGIDGYRAIAQRTGLYAGSDKVLFDSGLTSYQCLQTGSNRPVYASATVWKIVHGQRVSFDGESLWDEFYPGDGAMGYMWRSKPFLMLGKTAEAQALRKAFPEELSGVEIGEDGDGFGGDRTNPADYRKTELWLNIETFLRTAQSVEQVNKGERKALAKVDSGELPAIARGGIEREVTAALERLSDAELLTVEVQEVSA